MGDERPAKRVSESAIEMIEIVLPSDANHFGNVIGGKVMHLVDIAGAMSAIRHCRRPVVTASVERLDFRHPIKVGHFIILRAGINYVGRSSIEVSVQVLSEDPLTGEQRHTSTAYLTFVALDDAGQPMEVPALILETEEERHRYEVARLRRQQRLESQPYQEEQVLTPREEVGSAEQWLRYRNLMVDLAARRVELGGRRLDLTPTEFDILCTLMNRSGQVLTCQQIVQTVYDYEIDERNARLLLRPHISRLRQKLSSDPEAPPHIVNVWGVGYMFERRRAVRED